MAYLIFAERTKYYVSYLFMISYLIYGHDSMPINRALHHYFNVQGCFFQFSLKIIIYDNAEQEGLYIQV